MNKTLLSLCFASSSALAFPGPGRDPGTVGSLGIDLRSAAFQALDNMPDFVAYQDGLLIQNADPPPDGGSVPYDNFAFTLDGGLAMSHADQGALSLAVFSDRITPLTGVWVEIAPSSSAQIMVGENATGPIDVIATVSGESYPEYVPFEEPLNQTKIYANSAQVIGFTTAPQNVPETGNLFLVFTAAILMLFTFSKLERV